MRILHVTDTHLGVAGWYRGAPAGWSRADDHARALRTALGPARRGEVDLVVHSGDLFDRSRPPAAATATARDLLGEVARQVPVVILPGNHDRAGLTEHLRGAEGDLRVCDAPSVVTVGALRLGMMPWSPSPAAWTEAVAGLARTGFDLLVCHASFAGVRVPGFTFRVGTPAETLGRDALPRGVRHVLCGHIHPRQALRLGDAEIVHPGATERTSFVERREPKGVVHWELGRTLTWRFVDLPARPMRQIDAAEEVAEVGEGELVLLGKELRNVEIEQAVLARGGWVHAWKAPSPQLGLFG